MVTLTKQFRSQCATDAKAQNYGGPSYWDHLETHSISLHDKFLARGDIAAARNQLSQRLGEVLRGNEGI